jgi:ParB family transcriptional regulator, chromosome partitioning protein
MKKYDDSHVFMIPVKQIRVINPRSRDQKAFGRIVESIAAAGLKRPITVTLGQPGDDRSEMFDLVCGQGRLEAFIQLGAEEIPAFVKNLSLDESLLASLIENIARRRVSTIDQVKMIQWMKDQKNDSADIAEKTGLGESYVKDILGMLERGEERLLDGVLHGRIPVTIANQISGLSDEESQRLLTEVYEKKEMTQKTLRVFKRIVDLRRSCGKGYGERHRRGSGARRSAESLIRAYRKETQRQKLMVKKAKLCQRRLLSVAAAFKVLLREEDYITLLRAEKLDTIPKFLAERAKENA